MLAHMSVSLTGTLHATSVPQTRFVNCKWGAEKEQEKRLANACAEVVFDEAASMPAVFLYATRRIDPGEEVMADYGDEYWRIMSRYLQMQHHKWVVPHTSEPGTVWPARAG